MLDAAVDDAEGAEQSAPGIVTAFEDFLAMLRSGEMRRRNRDISALCKSFEPVMYEVAGTFDA